MPKYTQTKMCDQCPFRENAPAGWLGPYTPEEVQQLVHGEGTFACHVSTDKMLKKVRAGKLDEDLLDNCIEHCVGFLRYRNLVCKRGHDPIQYAAQERLRSIPDKPILQRFQFLEYHINGPLAEASTHDDT